MATSVYFNNYNSFAEQRVVEDLIVETIKIMGSDAYYLPNDNDAARDLLYGEDPVKKFTSAFPVEIYLSTALEYMGEKDFFSKFGLEIKNNINVILSKRTFSQRVPQNQFTRPREGDLIYVPFMNGVGELYEIKFANQNKDFNMLGRKIPFFYELELEKFRYSQEALETGVADIDVVVTDSAYTIDLLVNDGSGDYTLKEIVFQSPDSTHANATVVGIVQNWVNYANGQGLLSVSNIAGEFLDNNSVIGGSSQVNWIVSTYNPLDVNLRNEKYDNLYIETQGNNILDMSESNPFGAI